jgi:hypothetical protein
MSENWPLAQLDAVERLRVLAAGFPGAGLDEQLLPADFARVWGFFSDMERSLPRFDRTVAKFRVISRDGSRLVGRALGPRLPLGFTFDVDLEPGWCWMTARPRIYVVAFAAVPEGDQTRFAHFEAYNIPGPTWLRRVGTPALKLSAAAVGRHVHHDVNGIAAAVS